MRSITHQFATAIIHSTLKRLAAVLMLTMSICSCRTVSSLNQEPLTLNHQDSVFQYTLQHDSIYIYESKERIHDTLLLTQKEYRYKLLRDTLRMHQVDTIPVVRTVVQYKDPPSSYPNLLYIGVLGLLIGGIVSNNLPNLRGLVR